ncbi:hypothetical protein [Acidomonas methanolica]|uniref:Uncharacterized protein n=1 Tax=Acidomonas methanolica NBRC 104435 TaxID=1231351 RepID=A0A023D3H7_ACIMT|nr:hypothetical protein [Acidomonas methanolica]TCS31459.1 hypothetical protein EDC31_1026 [Acidomonas methanolica]GAJ28320.1 hypothetical protein Amme_018_045 [Acidomonas methanolica NBRC 104435]GBQ59891.1 hypothetical protein AA0498_2805 [Acidomonas methanolica]GEK97877.1 hypothetical protein AME01nite_03760 [Acidomonas methanolica NBRC 104435]
MARTTKRSAVNLTMTVEELTAELAQEHEEWLSRKPQTVYDLVKQIYEPLLKMKQDGRTDSEICDMLTKRGIDISAGTFATYMKRIAKETRGSSRPRQARKPKPDAIAASNSDMAGNPNDSRVRPKPSSDSGDDSRASKSARPTSDSAPAKAASPSMDGFSSRPPPAFDA